VTKRCRQLVGWGRHGPAALLPCPVLRDGSGCPRSLSSAAALVWVQAGSIHLPGLTRVDLGWEGAWPRAQPEQRGWGGGTLLAVPGDRHLCSVPRPAVPRAIALLGRVPAPSACHSYPRHRSGASLQQNEGVWVLAAPQPRGSLEPGLRSCPLHHLTHLNERGCARIFVPFLILKFVSGTLGSAWLPRSQPPWCCCRSCLCRGVAGGNCPDARRGDGLDAVPIPRWG